MDNSETTQEGLGPRENSVDEFADADETLPGLENGAEIPPVPQDAPEEEDDDEPVSEINKLQIQGNITQDVREQALRDEHALEGVHAFFANDYARADALFAEQRAINPLYALGAAGLSVLRAFMTFNDGDAEQAMANVRHVEAVATVQLEHLGHGDGNLLTAGVGTAVNAVKSVASLSTMALRMVGRGFLSAAGGSALPTAPTTASTNNRVWKPAALRALVLRAEATLLSAVLFMFRENFASLVRAGLRLRRSYKALNSAWTQVQALDPESANGLELGSDLPAQVERIASAGESQIDPHTLGGVLFTVGAQNLFLSILPSKVLMLVSFFGFTGQRPLGIALLEASAARADIHAPLALLVLSTYHGVFGAFAPHFLRPVNLATAQRLGVRARALCPNSVLHRYMSARLRRFEGSPDACVCELEDLKATARAAGVAAGPGHRGSSQAVEHLCAYELALSHACRSDYASARKAMQTLEHENYWSRAFCLYFIGACHVMEQQWDAARDCFARAPAQVRRKYGGRVIAVEQFVLTRCRRYADASDDDLGRAAPVLELLYIWNSLPLCTAESLGLADEELSRRLAVCDDSVAAHVPCAAILRAVRAQVRRELNLCRAYPYLGSLPVPADKPAPDPPAPDELEKPRAAVLADLDWIQGRESTLRSSEPWLAPFTRYDRAVLGYIGAPSHLGRSDGCPPDDRAGLAAALTAVRDHLDACKRYNGYVFEFRLEFRIHLARMRVVEQLDALGAPKV